MGVEVETISPGDGEFSFSYRSICLHLLNHTPAIFHILSIQVYCGIVLHLENYSGLVMVLN